jgi:hypothetical protein
MKSANKHFDVNYSNFSEEAFDRMLSFHFSQQPHYVVLSKNRNTDNYRYEIEFDCITEEDAWVNYNALMSSGRRCVVICVGKS